MNPSRNPFNALRSLKSDKQAHYYALSALEEQGLGKISRLPVSIRVMLESLLRNCDEKLVRKEDVESLAKWSPTKKQSGGVPFIVARVLLQDFTGVPLVVDLAAMRDAAAKKGFDAAIIEPQVPVDLVVDHSVQVDRAGKEDAFLYNLKIEFDRNGERYSFLKWGQQAFESFGVVPPGIGICHQVNLEYFASVVIQKKSKDGTLLYPDTLVGTDSHTTMINGLGVVGWGVGGIEAQSAMLGQPVTIPTPEVIGVHLSGKLKEGVTATDLTLRITEMLRKENVVDKFVEFYGEGASNLTVADRATIGNMAPEYGATIGFFPVDEKTLDYLRMTGRDEKSIALVKEYLSAQGLFGIPKKGEVDFTKSLDLNLSDIVPSVSGPKRPQDRIPLPNLKSKFRELLKKPVSEGGYEKGDEKQWPVVSMHSDGSFTLKFHHDAGGKSSIENRATWSEDEMVANRPFTEAVVNPGYSEAAPCNAVLTHGSVVIAAITSCTNTSNPSVMLAAGLVAKKAVEKGLTVSHTVKTSLAPGSRVVTDYLKNADLQKYLDQLGFDLVAYGCTTCIGNSGPLDETIENAVKEHDLIAASVLSGNRNFEARIHSSVKANFLMSPPLVVAFALAGRVDIDFEKEPIGKDPQGKPVFLRDIWPTSQEIEALLKKYLQPEIFKKRYSNILTDNPVWSEIKGIKGAQFPWESKSTYIQNPPYFEGFELKGTKKTEFKEMRCLALFGDSVTTDHISPAGLFSSNTPAGKYLHSLGVPESDFNSYGSRRGNHHVMMRGTFANVRIKNKMADGKEGGFTKLMPEGELQTIFDACQAYAKRKVPLIVFAGKDYGMGSSRDWAAKGAALLGVKAVIAQSFERIHRSNLIGMGVLPLEFQKGESHESLGIKGDELFTITGVEGELKTGQEATLEIKRGGKVDRVKLIVRLDTPIEIDYYRAGGIMPYVLRKILEKK
ncbi:MAG: aconitate hydratase [Chlamydiales bacterium]|nr:aconitate hydratase [Chlamydiales bacterium]